MADFALFLHPGVLFVVPKEEHLMMVLFSSYGWYPKYRVVPETSGLPATQWFPKLNRVGSGSGTRWALEVSRGTWLTSKLVEEVVDKKSVKRFWVQTFSIQSVYSSFIAKNSFQESCWQGRKSGWCFCQGGPTFATFLVSHTLCQRHLLLWLYYNFLIWELTKKGGISSEALFHWEDKNLVNIWLDECKFMQIYLFVGIFTGSGIFLRKNGGFWIWRDSAK